MKEWEDFLGKYVKGEKFEYFRYTEGEYHDLDLEPIILKTIQLMNRLEQSGNENNVFLFPKLKPLVNQLVMSIAIYDIVNENIPAHYNPLEYEVGQKLMVGDAVVLYEGTENGRIKIATRGGDHLQIPYKLMPVFQKADNSRALSSYDRYCKNKKKYLDVDSKVLNMLWKNKSYLEKSIIYVSDINKAELKARFDRILINDIPLNDLLLIRYADKNGNFEGKFDSRGTPAVIVVNDFCSVKNILKKNVPVYRVICNFKNDAMDQAADLGSVMRKLKVPFTVFGNLFQAFSLDVWKAKSFNVFKWDSQTITPSMYSHTGIPAFLESCHKRRVEYVTFEDETLSSIFDSLNYLKALCKSEDRECPSYYWELYNSFCKIIRNIVPDNAFACIRDNLSLIKASIEEDLFNVSVEEEKEYRNIINLLNKYLNTKREDISMDKSKWLVQELAEKQYERVAVIVPDRENITDLKDVWSYCYLVFAKDIKTKVDFYTPSMLSSIPKDYDNYYVVSWFLRNQMQHLLYNYEITDYTILLYDFEKKTFRDRTVNSWNKTYDSMSTLKAVKKFYHKSDIDVVFKETDSVETEDDSDDLEDFEVHLFKSRFNKFFSSSYSGDVIVPAYPVTFTDGRMCAFTENHKIVQVNSLIKQENKGLKLITAKDLKKDDYIAIGQSNREFIKELADKGLEKSGLGNLRETANLWRVYMESYLRNYTKKEFVEALYAEGLKTNKMTIDVWIRDSELIAPRSDSLVVILKVCKPDLSEAEINDIDTACRTIQNAHRDAGKEFSKALKKRLAELISSNSHLFKDHDGCVMNIEVEDMGTVDILKVATVFAKIELERNKTNRVQEL